jgi:magnesium-transporting ATPase (P-type)
LEKASLETVYASLSTSPKGLTSADAKQRTEQYGRNELVEEEISDLEKFLRFFTGPIAYMIEGAALLSLLMGHWADLTIILVLLFYNAISGFWQERKASDALAALKAGMAPKATALRDGDFRSIDTAAKATGTVSDLAAKGLRALGVAQSTDDGASWSFLGILSMLDPPRDDSKETIEHAKEHGLQVKMVTGDDLAIGSQISGQLGS